MPRIVLPTPRKRDELMSAIPGPTIEDASELTKHMIDYIMDNAEGAVPGKLRDEMVMSKEVFDYEFDEYELFVWMFSEHFQPGEFEYRLAEAVAAAGKRRQQGGIDVVAKAFMKMIHDDHP